MKTTTIASVQLNRTVKVSGPGVSGLTMKGDGRLDETRDHLNNLPKDSVILSMDNARFKDALVSYGSNANGPKAAALLGQGWEPKTIDEKRGIFVLNGTDSSQFVVLDRAPAASIPTSGAIISQYSFDQGNIQQAVGGLYNAATQEFAFPQESLRVSSAADLQYNIA